MIHRYLANVLIVAFAVTLVLSMGRQSYAQLKRLSADALTKESDLIVVGKVGKVDCAWADGKKGIETRVTVEVFETIKGSSLGNTITVVVPGGEVDGVGEWYSHTPRFGQDEDIVLFTMKDSGGKFRVTGGEQGKVTVTKDTKTGAKTVGNAGTLDEFTTAIRKTVKSQETIIRDK